MILTGKMISPGVARGITHVVDTRALIAAARGTPALDVPEKEVERLHAAIGNAIAQLGRLQRQLTGRVRAGDVAIFASHASLLRDPKLISPMEQAILEQGLSAEAAVADVSNELYAAFQSNRAALLQDKAADILDIGRRLLNCLSETPHSEAELGADTVIVAAALTPSELVRFAHQGVVAIVAEFCGAKSHTAILARGLAIPMLSGVSGVCAIIPDHADILVDATGGRLFLAATDSEQSELAAVLDHQRSAGTLGDACPDPPVTADGVTIRLLLNISDPLEALAVQQLGSSGVGLFRTEFLYMDRSAWPSAEENYAIYRGVADALGDAELHMRLVDFGAEKCPPYADFPMNRNPSLGLRGVRLLLQRDDILEPQVVAIARLARERPLTVLLPMLDTLDTLSAILRKICRFAGCEQRAQLPFRVGTMLEVPAAACMVEEILRHVDSAAIGLNDLTQYLLAADRDDESVESYHDAMQPCVLRLVSRIIDAAAAQHKPLTICGELAGDPRLTGLLLALGIRRLSVSRTNYREAVATIRRLSLRSMTGIPDVVLKLNSGAEVHEYVNTCFSGG